MKLSVIIPVYGVAGFVERCAESLMRQSMREGVEFIFVDDATPDDSIALVRKVVERHPERAAQVRILTHEANQGLPAARNTGLQAATGRYILHCDADDYAEPTMLEELYSAAEAEDADVVWCDWYLTFEQSERYMTMPALATADEALRAMLGGRMKYNVWNKLVRRSLYEESGIEFPSGHGMGEDMTMIRLMANARRVAYMHRALYHYVKTNTASFCQTYSERHLADLKYNVSLTADYLTARLGDAIARDLAFFKLEAKFPFLISDGRNGEYRRWREWYPEANAYIMQNHNITARSRWVQWLAAHNFFAAVRIYNWALTTLYRVMYR
ncbi:MAG: glycosyltransferase family 2 protein [Muribaculaceae bacterium]